MKYLLIQDKGAYREYPITNSDDIDGMIPNVWMEKEDRNIMLLDEEISVYERKKDVFISEKDGDIRIKGCSAQILLREGQMQIENSKENFLCLNQEKVGDGIYALEDGAVLLVENCKIVIGSDCIKIWGKPESCSLQEIENKESMMEGFPLYKRSPRLIKRVENGKIRIEAEPVIEKTGAKGLLQMVLPPLCMLTITVVIGILLKRGLMMLMSVSATVMTTIFSVVKYFQDRKALKEKEARKKEVYGKYLLDKRKEIHSRWKKEEEAYSYNYPGLLEIESMVERYDSRIYERNTMDEDFLTFSIGHFSSKTAFTIEDKTGELSLETTEFSEEIKEIKRKFGSIDKPQIVDLKRGHLGLVGEKSVIHEQLKYYISQIAFAQSYHDVQFIAIYAKEYEEDFAWMRWLSHARLQGLNVYGLIRSEKTRDQILGSVQQILKERRQRIEEEKKESRFLPHFVFLIDEPKLILDHSIMEFLSGSQGMQLGFSIIYTSYLQANLPENIGTVLLLENSEEGRLLLQEKEVYDRKLHLYRVGNANLDMMARNLGVLVHEQGLNSHIPESITFFDMYGIRNPEELRIRERWGKNNSSKTLAVPLGARAVDDYLELNLHEKAHGPHGLVAGTTGSGKSEIVQSYILSLAVNFHPCEVGFLLIDYKGGGMANLFKSLPHLLGTITNLDGSESMRALASIQSELRRRQSIFGKYEVNHINAYNDLFKEGKAAEPIPHLFIISDEFAELKKEQPDFMKELVSTARIGRSLGVHLILATQKPSGVVDDQIWTNSKFKLCLKVQNESDSKEVLHTPDAANITQAGRAYLQVGNNEVYELFQSAWSGAMYIPETEKEVTQDNRVYMVNSLGQGELINRDLRGTQAEQKAKETQLDAVVNHIREVYEKEKAIEVKKPWLPSLPDKLINPYMAIHGADKVNLRIAIGMRDIPEEQIQEDYVVDLAKQGNVAYIASGGYGKSVFLANAVLNLAAQNKVSNLNFYVLDFGNNALISLKGIPHMADYIMLDDEEKFEKFRDLMSGEMQKRKRMLAAAMAQNFTVYNEIASEPLKAIVILLDNYDAVKEMGYDMESYFTRLSRDGVGLGIYMVITASRMSAVRTAMLNNFKNKIAGVNFDQNEVNSLVGRSKYTLSDVRGRALVKEGDYTSIMQLYTPVDFTDDTDYGKNIQQYVGEVKACYPDEEAPHIPILPDEVTCGELLSGRRNKDVFLLGLDRETVQKRGMDGIHMPFLILGEGGSGKTNILRLILSQIEEEKVYLIDSRSRDLYSYQEKVHYLSDKNRIEDFTNELKAETERRKHLVEQAMGEGRNPKEAAESLEPYYVVIDDIDDFCEQAGTNLNIIAGRFEQAAQQGIRFIVTANVNKFKGTDNFTKLMKSARNGVLLSSQGYLTIFPVKAMETIAMPDGYLMQEGRGGYIRIPRA